jgi:Flp pilus assembly protein TadG
VVEFAIVAPIFILLLLGMIEFGRMIMVQQVLTNAAREGARRAVIEGSTKSEVETQVNNYLANSSITGTTVTVEPSNLSNLAFGDPVKVSVSVPFNSVTWTGGAWFLGDTTLDAGAIMQAERLQ